MPEDHHPIAEGMGRLSAQQAAELAGQVAALAKSGLPLEPGLRALADELPRGRLAGVLREMAARLQAGASLDEVVCGQGSRLPAHVRGLLLAGVRSGRLAEVMEEFVDLHRAERELGRRVWLSLAYPILLLSMLSVLFLLLDRFIVGEFAKIFADFEAELPAVTEAFLSAGWLGAWGLAGGTALLVLAVVLLTSSPAGPPGVPQLLYMIPLVGPLWRWSRLVQFSKLMGVLLQQGTPLPQALRLTAEGVHDAYLALGCRQVAAEVEAGRTLSESLASRKQFPPTLIPLVNWGQCTSALPEAFRASAEVFDGNLQKQGALMETALLPITFLVVIGFVSLFIIAMLTPLISLIENLSAF